MNETQAQVAAVPQQETRKVGIGLGIGIVLVPMIFSWFTLRKGYSTVARGVSLGWMVLALLMYTASGKKAPVAAVVAAGAQAPGVAQATPARAEAPAEAKAAAVEIGAAQLVKEYESNELKADSLYKGKRIRTSGTVDSIGKDILNHPYVTLGAKSSLFQVQCSFEDDDAAQKAIDLKPGDKITMEGEVSGKMMHVQVKDCAIVP